MTATGSRTCPIPLASGPRKGHACGARIGRSGRPTCLRHASHAAAIAPLHDDSPFTDLPEHVIENICASLVPASSAPEPKEYAALLAMKLVSKEFRRVASRVIAERLVPHVPRRRETAALTGPQRVELEYGRGCMACPHHPRTSKVYWPIPVRLCDGCFRRLTVPTFALARDYGIPEVHYFMLDAFRFDGYNANARGYSKSYTMFLVLTSQVERNIGCSLRNYMTFAAARASMQVPEVAAMAESFRIERQKKYVGDAVAELVEKSPAWRAFASGCRDASCSEDRIRAELGMRDDENCPIGVAKESAMM